VGIEMEEMDKRFSESSAAFQTWGLWFINCDEKLFFSTTLKY